MGSSRSMGHWGIVLLLGTALLLGTVVLKDKEALWGQVDLEDQ